MAEKDRLRYVRHGDINFARRDECIYNADNSRVYATGWYLDRAAEKWDALVWDDYAFVMPLPVKRKFGIKYLYQPLYCQQLGIFPRPPAEIALQFYHHIFKRFRYSEIQLNSYNLPVKQFEKATFTPRKNHLLHLNTDYEVLISGFSKNTHRNIIKAGFNGLSYIEGIRLEDFIEFKQKNRTYDLSEKELQKLKSIIAYSQYKGFGRIVGVYSLDNILQAAVFFLRWKDRVIYLNAVSGKEGKEARAMFLLMDYFLKSCSGKDLTLDFEGSTVPGIARFFEGFGATPETYYQMKINRLPFMIKWLKQKSE